MLEEAEPQTDNIKNSQQIWKLQPLVNLKDHCIIIKYIKYGILFNSNLNRKMVFLASWVYKLMNVVHRTVMKDVNICFGFWSKNSFYGVSDILEPLW